MGGSDNKGDGLASQPCGYRVPGQPLLNHHQVGGVSRSTDGLFAQQEREPIRGRPAVRGKGHMVDSRDNAWRNRAPGPHAHRTTARQAMDGLWTEAHGQQKQSNDPANNQHILNAPTMDAADAQTAHHATFSTAPTHQILGSANAETTPARALAAAADRKQQPNATCEGKNG